MKGSKDSLFLVLLSPNDHIFLLIVSAVTQTPPFLHSAATGSYFLFQFHRQIDNFCHFRRFFVQIPVFKTLSETSKVTFSPNDPLILSQQLASHPMTPHFLRLFSHRMPSLWKCEPYIRIHLISEYPPVIDKSCNFFYRVRDCSHHNMTILTTEQYTHKVLTERLLENQRKKTGLGVEKNVITKSL